MGAFKIFRNGSIASAQLITNLFEEQPQLHRVCVRLEVWRYWSLIGYIAFHSVSTLYTEALYRVSWSMKNLPAFRWQNWLSSCCYAIIYGIEMVNRAGWTGPVFLSGPKTVYQRWAGPHQQHFLQATYWSQRKTEHTGLSINSLKSCDTWPSAGAFQPFTAPLTFSIIVQWQVGSIRHNLEKIWVIFHRARNMLNYKYERN